MLHQVEKFCSFPQTSSSALKEEESGRYYKTPSKRFAVEINDHLNIEEIHSIRLETLVKKKRIDMLRDRLNDLQIANLDGKLRLEKGSEIPPSPERREHQSKLVEEIKVLEQLVLLAKQNAEDIPR